MDNTWMLNIGFAGFKNWIMLKVFFFSNPYNLLSVIQLLQRENNAKIQSNELLAFIVSYKICFAILLLPMSVNHFFFLFASESWFTHLLFEIGRINNIMKEKKRNNELNRSSLKLLYFNGKMKFLIVFYLSWIQWTEQQRKYHS